VDGDPGPLHDGHESAGAADAGPRLFAGVGFPVMEDQAIVEMKYRRELPAVLRRAVEMFKLTPAPVSKYRVGFDALGYGSGATGTARHASLNLET
jgi:hypothetical protein